MAISLDDKCVALIAAGGEVRRRRGGQAVGRVAMAEISWAV